MGELVKDGELTKEQSEELSRAARLIKTGRTERERKKAAKIFGSYRGKVGGAARAKKLSPRRRLEIAKKASRAAKRSRKIRKEMFSKYKRELEKLGVKVPE